MSTTTLSEGRRFTPGMTFPDLACTITREEQEAKLRCCGLDPALHGDRIDLTQLAYLAVLAVRQSGISINGRVHMTQVFDQRQPLYLGEPLIVRGKVLAVTPERRGQIEESQFDFIRPDGSIPLSTRRSSLLLDPKVGAARKPDGGAAPRPAADPRDGMTLIARHQLVPEMVAAYSGEAENLIHSDPETARRFGFRAPIAAGLMAVHYMMAALCRPTPPARASSRADRSKTAAGPHRPPDRLRMSVRFRRPMFWDETLEVWGRHTGDDAAIAALAVINPEGKVANDAVVDAVGYGADA